MSALAVRNQLHAATCLAQVVLKSRWRAFDFAPHAGGSYPCTTVANGPGNAIPDVSTGHAVAVA
eukprot:2781650-Rhodomonas_salina.1